MLNEAGKHYLQSIGVMSSIPQAHVLLTLQGLVVSIHAHEGMLFKYEDVPDILPSLEGRYINLGLHTGYNYDDGKCVWGSE